MIFSQVSFILKDLFSYVITEQFLQRPIKNAYVVFLLIYLFLHWGKKFPFHSFLVLALNRVHFLAASCHFYFWWTGSFQLSEVALLLLPRPTQLAAGWPKFFRILTFSISIITVFILFGNITKLVAKYPNKIEEIQSSITQTPSILYFSNMHVKTGK